MTRKDVCVRCITAERDRRRANYADWLESHQYFAFENRLKIADGVICPFNETPVVLEIHYPVVVGEEFVCKYRLELLLAETNS